MPYAMRWVGGGGGMEGVAGAGAEGDAGLGEGLVQQGAQEVLCPARRGH